MGLIRQRHNDILQRLIEATPDSTGSRFVEQEVPSDTERNKPDLVIISPDKQEVTIVDVMVPFERDEESFSKARKAKETKYSSLKSWILNKKATRELGPSK